MRLEYDSVVCIQEWHAAYAVGGGMAVAAPSSGIPVGWLHVISFGQHGPFNTYNNYFDGVVTAVAQHQCVAFPSLDKGWKC